jgi:hypothetical protein
MEAINLADKLWDIANFVTGFAIAQVLATTFALVKTELKPLTGALAHWIAFLTTLLFTGFYIYAIVWCEIEGTSISSERHDIWRRVTQGRIIAVGIFTLVLFMALLGHWRDERIREPLSGGDNIAPSA